MGGAPCHAQHGSSTHLGKVDFLRFLLLLLPPPPLFPWLRPRLRRDPLLGAARASFPCCPYQLPRT